MRKFAPLLIIAAACLWGTMGLFVRHLNAVGLASMEIVEIRCIIAALILLPISLIRNPALLKLRLRQVPPLIASATCSILFFNYCYFRTISIMNLSAAAILLYTSPIFVMLLSLVCFREAITVRKITALFLAFGGCILVSGILSDSVPISALGILLGLGSGLGYALYSIFSRVSLNQGLHSITITNYTFLFAAVFGIFLTDFRTIWSVVQTGSWQIIAYFIFYTLVTTVFPYLLYTTGLSYVENGKASVMATVEPVVATLLGLLVFSEVPALSALIGMVLVVLALIVLSTGSSSREKSARDSSVLGPDHRPV